MKVLSVKLNVLRKHPKNPRIHSKENIRAIADSLENFGQQSPIIINNRLQILKGNGTFDAMILLGWSRCQVAKVFNLSPEDELAYLLADNKTSDMSEFDFEQVTDIFKSLDEKGIDLTKTGFRDFETIPLLDTDWNKEENNPPTIDGPPNLKITLVDLQALEAKRILEKGRKVFSNNKYDDNEILLAILIYWDEQTKNLKLDKIRRRKK